MARSWKHVMQHARLPVAALGMVLCAAQIASGSGTWTATGTMAEARSFHTATRLADGRVLVAGGWNFGTAFASAEVYDPDTGTWSSAGTMHVGRWSHTATLLPDGRVLVAGGAHNGGTESSAELYDPGTNTWALTGGMTVPRVGQAAALLADGKVLVVGGHNEIPGCCYLGFWSSAELYDPGTGMWLPTGGMSYTRMDGHTATLLPNGHVLVAGGHTGSMDTSSAEVYNPWTGAWSLTASMSTAHHRHTATLLPSGKVLVASGYSGGASAELYDFASGTWSPTGSLAVARHDHAAALLATNQVVIAGGADNSGGAFLASTELYDETTGTWSLAGDMTTPRTWLTATPIASNEVLVAGGFNGTVVLASAERYAASGDSDTTPPVLSLPNDVTAEATSPAGAVVTYMASAFDDVDGAITPGCDPASGATFPPGTTQVTCTATDSSGNSSSGHFDVLVQDTMPPVIACNAPATITPPNAPVAFTATAADPVSTPTTLVTGYDCSMVNPSGRLVDKTDSCVVRLSGAMLTVLDSGGVGDHITWTVESIDAAGNLAVAGCAVDVVRPSSRPASASTPGGRSRP